MPAARPLRPLSSRHALMLLVGCALLLRMLIPAGWMPVSDHHGLRIVLCSGTGVAEGWSAPSSGDHHGSAHHQEKNDVGAHNGQPCIFAGISMPWTAAGPVLLPLIFPLAALTTPLAVELVAVGRGLAAPPPPPTGPPATF